MKNISLIKSHYHKFQIKIGAVTSKFQIKIGAVTSKFQIKIGAVTSKNFCFFLIGYSFSTIPNSASAT